MVEETLHTEQPQNDIPAQPAGAAQPSSFEPLVRETARLLETFGKVLVKTAEELSSLMVIQVDADTRQQLDELVEANMVKSRKAGAEMLLQEGVKAKADLFEQVERTNARIAALRQQVHSLTASWARE